MNAWPMIERCGAHQTDWVWEEHRAEMVRDGMIQESERNVQYGEYVPESQSDRPPFGSYDPLDQPVLADVADAQ